MDNLLIVCIVLLCVVIALILAIILYYIFKVSNFGIRKLRKSKTIAFIGKNKKPVNVDDISTFITGFVTSLARLSLHKVGGLIIIENRDSLQKYIELGNKMDSPFFPEFVYSIFYNHESALHDGAMIIRNFRINSLSSYVPVSKRVLSVKYGARHRAAFGISERTDALAFVVSETTGNISFMYGAEVMVLSSDPSKLADQITSILFSKYYMLVDNTNPIIKEKIKERMN